VDPATARQLTTWFGDNAPSVMSSLHESILGSDATDAQTTRYYSAVNNLMDQGAATKTLNDKVMAALPKDVAASATPEQVSDLVQNLRDYVAGTHTDGPQAKVDATNRMVEDSLRQHFGSKTDSLLEAFDKEREGSVKSSLGAPADAAGDQEALAGSTTEQDGADQAAPTQYLGAGKDAKNPQPVLSDTAHKAQGFDTQSQAERLLAQAKVDNPDSNVAFTHMRDLPDDVRAKFPDASQDHGLVTVDSTKDETRITPDEFNAMRVDTSKTSHAQDNPSRIDTGVKGAVLDGRAIVKTMEGKLPYNESDDKSPLHRKARAFMEGVAGIQDHMGKSFDVPDSTVIAKSGGKDFTYGDAKKLSFRPDDPAWMRGKTDAEINTALGRADTLKDMGDRELAQAHVRAQDVVDKRTAAYQEQVQQLRASGTRLDKAGLADLRKTMGVEDARSAVAQAETEQAKRDGAVRKAQNLDNAGRTEVGKDEQIHTAADHNTAADLQQRTNDDGTALQHQNFDQKNPDGSLLPSTRAAISTKINSLENGKTAIARNLGAKARDLFNNLDGLKKVDQALLASVVKDKDVSSIASTVNDLYTKYAKVISEKAGAPKKLNTFTERVLGEGDLASIKKQIKASDDVAGVQRAIDSLAEHADNPRAKEVLDAANERMTKFVEGPNGESIKYSAQMDHEQRAASSEASRQRDVDMVESLRKNFAPGMRVHIVEDATIPANGQVRQHTDGHFEIRVRPARNAFEQADVIAHEFGHALQTHLYDTAPDAVKSKIRGEYDALVQKYKDDPTLTAKDYARDFLNSSSLLDAMKAGTTESARSLMDRMDAAGERIGQKNYARDFDEYFANQFAKYISAGAETAPVETRGFWQRAMRTMMKFYKDVVQKTQPGVEFKAWAESLRTDSEAKFSAQRIDPNLTHTSGVEADVHDYINKVLGKSVDVEFAKMLHAGEFFKDGARTAAGMAEDVIRVSVHSLDPMSTAYHESLHGFMAKLNDQNLKDAASPLFKAADSPGIRLKLERLLVGEPAALKQIASSSEERAAYMYQFWANGQLELGGKAATTMGKIGEFFRKILGLWSNDERALHIMDHFQSGEYAKQMNDRGAVQASLLKGADGPLSRFKEMIGPFDTLASRVVSTGDAQVRDLKNAALTSMLDKVLSPLQGDHGDVGYIPAARAKRTAMLNDLASGLHGYEPAVITDALQSMQRGERGASPAERQVVMRVRKTLDSMYGYMTDSGVKMGDLGYGKDYFPRVWDANKVLSNEPAFRAMMQQYKDSGEFSGSVDQIMAALTRGDGSELQVETAKPGNQFTKERILGFIKGHDAAPFLNDNLYQTLNSYITQGTKRAEWASRFGDDGAGLKKIFTDARAAGATDDHIELAQRYLKGVDGTLGDSIDPKLRKAFGNMIVYQNIRLLPLALFSSLIDPLGIAVRGGSAGDAFNAFKRGIKEIPKGFKDVNNRKDDQWTKVAENMGVIDSAVLQHTIGTSYSQGMTSDIGRKINDTFFKYNLMEQFNTSMRVAATESAVGFLGRHADGTASPHSARWLKELGLDTKDVVKQADGSPALSVDDFKAAGQSDTKAQESATKMQLAVNKWVDGAVLRPNAAHKPIWMNDPHFALVSHLKQFVYSFQETILKRVANESRNGNFGPAYALASYVPFMIAADLVKGLAVGGGSQPAYKDSWDAGDYLWSGVQRAGVFGVGQFGLDALKGIKRGTTGIGALAGPSVEQLGDAASTVGGSEQFKTFAMDALPANALFSAAEATTTNAAD